jgi:hypothetical protein
MKFHLTKIICKKKYHGKLKTWTIYYIQELDLHTYLELRKLKIWLKNKHEATEFEIIKGEISWMN